jgi:hypothetical protein
MQRMRIAGLATALLAAAAISAYAQGTVPAGTAIPVTLNDSVSSKDAKLGQKLSGSVSRDVTVNGRVVIPKGSNVSLSVASAQASGRLSTPAKLYLKIDSMDVRGKSYDVSARWVGRTGPSHAKRDTIAIGGGTAAGAIIGAIAGGGKGAAIGAAAGAGAGTAGAALTGKKDIEYPAETQLSFALKAALTVR